eukprot:TRINITY_DN17243_c0_g1_i1.p1 TRINITY_DN17243_c0_g1~~TRINITY_DN17243_c0_g1_i1.p1  ORF type:complete len:299 (-),score=87.12 TRINITY_DN17243_c0_g1_i1:114-1010(-)
MYLVLCLVIVVVDVCLSSLDCAILTDRRMLDTLDVNCSCQDWYGDQEIFKWSDLDDVAQTKDVQLKNIIFTKCSLLRLDLHPPHPVPLPHIMISDMNQVVISLSKDMLHPNMTINKVINVQYIPMDPMVKENTQNIVMYVALSVSVVLVLVLTVFLSVLLWSRMSNKDNSESKKVSRAESWRYEASMYVNPPNRPQPVFVPPPPFPDFIQPSTSSRQRTPDSVSSSPLLRPKYNSLREVDLVRTSLPIQQERQRQNTPPAYREPVDSIVPKQMHQRYSDTDESDDNSAQTLPQPHRYR